MTTEEQVRADVAKCTASNRFGIKCPMRDACSRFTAPASDNSQTWFTVAPFFGHVDEQKAHFGCDYYTNNGLELPRE